MSSILAPCDIARQAGASIVLTSRGTNGGSRSFVCLPAPTGLTLPIFGEATRHGQCLRRIAHAARILPADQILLKVEHLAAGLDEGGGSALAAHLGQGGHGDAEEARR